MSDHDPVGRPAAPGARPTPALQAALTLANHQHGALSRSQADDLGVTSGVYERLRQDAWRSPIHGAVVLPSSEKPFLGQVRAALLVATGSRVCGITAARLHGLSGLPAWHPNEPVHLLLPRRGGRRQRRGAVLHFSDLATEDCLEIHGIPSTSLSRTLTDLVLWLDRSSAVCVLDAALHEKHIDAEYLDDLADTLRRRRGGQACRSRLALADGRAESPLETRLRLLLVDAGLPPETLQHVVTDDSGRTVARLDLAWPSRRLDVEADGAAWHGEGPALYRDRWRQNELAAQRWTVVRFTWRDVTSHPDYVVATVAEHLRHRS